MVNTDSLENKKKEILSNLNESDLKQYLVLLSNNYYKYFKEQLCFEALLIDHPYDKDMLEEILELIVDTVCSKRKQIRIAGDDKPVNVVKSSFMKLDKTHIDYVLSCMKESSPDIRNIKQYILAALYNAPMTIGNYYQAMYNNDHANGLI